MTGAKLFFFAVCCAQASAAVANEDTENCAALPAKNTQVEERVMLQHSELRHMVASLHTQTGKQPPGYAVVGDGQCTDEDGSSVSKGWSPCTCGQATGSACAAGMCASADLCASDCDAETGCAAFAFSDGHCWLYSEMSKPYMKVTEAFQWYSCYVKASATTSTTSTTTTAGCVPYSQDACAQAATKAVLYSGGGGYRFAENHPTKGCYFYSYKSSDYGAMAFYGLGGTEAENTAPLSPPMYRIPGYECQTAYAPYSMEMCLQVALAQGMYVGGKGYEFADSGHSTKGCYTYPSGNAYFGYAYYGLGGTSSENEAALAGPQTRPGGYDGGCVPYSEETCRKAAAALGLPWREGRASPGAGCVANFQQGEGYTAAYWPNPNYRQTAMLDARSKDTTSATGPTYAPRIPGYDCTSACEPYSQAACARAALKKGLIMGKGTRPFVIDYAAAPAGCFTFEDGHSNAGVIQYNTQGRTPTVEEKQGAVESPYVRVVADCS